MDRNFSDMYQKDAAATCNTTTLGTLSGNDNVTSSDQLESDVLLSIKQEQMDEDIHFSDGTPLGDGSKKFFELTPVEVDVRESFTNYDANTHQDNSDDRSTRTERKMSGKWSEETTLKFIKEYRQLECLWDVKSPSYRNKAVRDAAYMKLADRASLPGFTVQEAKNKIKNLRSTYSQELKKEADVTCVMEEGITENEDTLEGNLQGLSPSHSQLSTPTESADAQSDRKSVKRNLPNPPPQTMQCKKKKIMHGSQMTTSSVSHFNHSFNSSKNDDEFDAFGRSVAAQLKKFSLAGALKTQVKIQSLLTQERIIDAVESESMSPNEDYNITHTPLTPVSHHSQSEMTCCNCIHEASQQVYATSEGLDDINSTDILSQAVNSILPE
ncbi:uncharacterized protein LOC110835002 isoform X2 [Zootermopsis nevadensis]|uniref:uncharacterized protein LOC110835002 isoform X2 n=1 Tax=Zootermopsis nevadensis TaxID=136037 RepID=UPI000B8E8EBD|nr:uncharacterized protein LOC110835002 isoform X2 [Zootermopsis nevadensis]